MRNQLSALLTRVVRQPLNRADALMNALYGWRWNPLYHSGAIVVILLAVVLVTGVYLLFFYRIGSPYESVVAINQQAWLGRWIRALHRYASDAIIIAAAFHVLRMFAQNRTWGPRALAWVSGVVLLFVIYVCGWTGFVMVWDTQGLVLAREGARWLDAVPIFAEPMVRTFSGDRDIPRAFFFLNLFLHVALPVGVAIALWVHTARIARPSLLPPRALSWGLMGILFAASIVWPAGIGPEADPLAIPGRAPYDIFYAFWLPFTQAISPIAVWIVGMGTTTAFTLVPWWTKPSRTATPPSTVVEKLCDACEQCYLDCPYEAISMVERTDGRVGLVSRVDPVLCVSCGICAGSCAPMGVGPAGRTGRHQLQFVKDFIATNTAPAANVVIIACNEGAGGIAAQAEFEGSPVVPVQCVGSMHTSVVEYLIRSGVGGVLIVACPPRDCRNREGPKWLMERLYHDREAELKPRVDKRRVRVAYAAQGEPYLVRRALTDFKVDMVAIQRSPETKITLDTECRNMPEEATPS